MPVAQPMSHRTAHALKDLAEQWRESLEYLSKRGGFWGDNLNDILAVTLSYCSSCLLYIACITMC